MKKNQTFNPIINGALRGVGLIAVVGLGIFSFNHIGTTTPEPLHNVSDTTQQEETPIDEGQSDTTLSDQLTQLQENLTALQSEFTQLQSGQTALEISLWNLIPVGSLVATNGNVTKEQMNAQGRALCDGTDISSQVTDATLKGTTLNLAGRTLVGEGTYAKNDSITFTLGHVDEYKIGDTAQVGEPTHLLTFAEMPYHTHGISMKLAQGGNSNTITVPNSKYSSTSTVDLSTQPAGGDQPHNNMPPFHVVQWYLKVK